MPKYLNRVEPSSAGGKAPLVSQLLYNLFIWHLNFTDMRKKNEFCICSEILDFSFAV